MLSNLGSSECVFSSKTLHQAATSINGGNICVVLATRLASSYFLWKKGSYLKKREVHHYKSLYVTTVRMFVTRCPSLHKRKLTLAGLCMGCTSDAVYKAINISVEGTDVLIMSLGFNKAKLCWTSDKFIDIGKLTKSLRGSV